MILNLKHCIRENWIDVINTGYSQQVYDLFFNKVYEKCTKIKIKTKSIIKLQPRIIGLLLYIKKWKIKRKLTKKYTSEHTHQYKNYRNKLHMP